jgi:hypothetical protein
MHSLSSASSTPVFGQNRGNKRRHGKKKLRGRGLGIIPTKNIIFIVPIAE